MRAVWTAALVGSAILFGVAGAPVCAEAQDEPAGALGLHFLASPPLDSDGDPDTAPIVDIGGLLNADLWFPIDWFRVGGFIGVGTIPSEEDTRNRLYMPFGASVAVEVIGDDVGFSIRARGGLWAGATQEVKLTVGGLVGGGAHLLVHLGAGTALNVGLDVYGILGAGETFVFAPGVGLSWNPAFESAP
ncbi:MAG: hypothetical protein AB8I08_05170 [Sandaracinaceae bacterium]